MSQAFASESPELQADDPRSDLLARLYHEIGLSAVAAALEIVNAADEKNEKLVFDMAKLPAILREDAEAA